MSEKRPLILVTNDDGITSKGISTLINVVKDLGEIVVVAPDSPQSGKGHAITIYEPLRLTASNLFKGIEAYECTGTPADCVKIAKNHLLKDRNIDLVVSGINHGSNSSISVLYSGTMSAAIEAAIEAIPAIGFSLCDYGQDPVFSHAEGYVLQIIKEALNKGLEKNIALNVNLPGSKENNPIKGIKICRQAKAKWQEVYEKRRDPLGRDYFWTTGELSNHDQGEDTDEWALANNFISIVPCQFDLTAYHLISTLNSNWNI